MGQPAVWKPYRDSDWIDCEVQGSLGSSYVIREVGKVWPGVALTPHVRIPAGVIFQPEILRRKYLPPGFDRWGKYRMLREELGREVALAVLAEHQEGGS